jgi:hypothetical protein
MKRRYRYTLNILSFGLLLVALYLNFVKKDSVDVSSIPVNSQAPVGAAKGETKTSAVTNSTQAFELR